MKSKPRWIIGIDEAGRGPLAGPVAVGMAMVSSDFDWSLIPRVADSKRVSPGVRDTVYLRACQLRQEGLLSFSVSLVRASVIDRIGITKAVSVGISRCFQKLKPDPATAIVKLDGLLRAPEKYVLQETIVRGDEQESIIGLASILAKVTRDRHMVRLSKVFPSYCFDAHKGYATELHRQAILTYDLSPIHRRTFCRNVLLRNAQEA